MYEAEVNDILRLAGLPLLEAEEVRLDEAPPSPKRLMPMFQGILEIAPQLKNQVAKEIEWAREALEREDRVIWYLRYLQISLLEQLSKSDSTFGQMVEKKIKQVAAKSGTTVGNIKSSLSMFMDGNVKRFLVHFLSMPISGIQQYTFAWQTPSEVYDTFNQLESDWREDQERTVPHDDAADLIIDFGDGYAWYDLNKSYCPAEAKAMGHCGNSPRKHSTDTILSLRRKQQVGDDVTLTPVLTFILDDNGMLGEMKGRGNDKPAKRYHKYIIPLLQHEAVVGIKGGGYMSENNFNISDLDDEVKDELIAEKPGLEGPTAVVEKLMNMGDYDRGIAAIEDLVREHGLLYQTFDVERDNSNWKWWNVWVDEWEDFHDVAREFDDKPVESLYSALDDINDMTFGEESFEKQMTPEIVLEILEKLPPEQQEAVIRGTDQDYSGSIDRYDALQNAASIIMREGNSNRFYHYLFNSIHDAIEDTTDLTEKTVKELRKKVIERIEEYANVGYPMRPHSFYTGPKEDNNWQGEWGTVIKLDGILDIIAAGIEGDHDNSDEYYFEYLEWNADGFRMDYDYLSENRSHSDLTELDQKDPLAEQIEEGIHDIELENMIDTVAYHFAQWITMRESKKNDVTKVLEESFDIDFEEILRRAGIGA